MTTGSVTQTKSDSQTAQPERRRELDLMGMFVVLGLVFFHTAMIFCYGEFAVKNAEPNMQPGLSGSHTAVVRRCGQADQADALFARYEAE